MLLVIDVGNSDATLGFYEKDLLKHSFRIKSLVHENYIYFENKFRNYFLENDISFDIINKVVISSVVPSLTGTFKNLCQDILHIEPFFLNPITFPLLKVDIHDPTEIGNDLYANAIAAYSKYKANCVVVDFGTALSFTIVSKEAAVVGVAIAPGLRTATKSLSANTAQLPDVPLSKPASVLGKDTIHAIQAGVLYGYEGLVKNMIRQIRAELGGECLAIATGGLSSVLTDIKEEFVEININLTMEGLRIVGETLV